MDSPLTYDCITILKYMGKDKSGNFHPKKGKPSGAGKSKGTGDQHAVLHEDENIMKQVGEQGETDIKYDIDEDANTAAGAKVTHPNRTEDNVK